MTRHLLRTTTALALVFSLGAPDAVPSAAANPSDITLAQAEEAGKPDEKENEKKKNGQGEGAAGKASGQAKKSDDDEASPNGDAKAEAEGEAQAEVKAESPGKSGEAPGQEKKAEADAQAEAEVEVEEDQAAEAAAEEETAAQAEAEPEESAAEAQAQGDAQAEVEEDQAAEAAAEEETEAQAEAEPEESAAEAQAQGDAQAEVKAESPGKSGEAPGQEKKTEEAEADAQAEAEAEVEEDQAAEAESEAEAQAEAEAEAAAEAETEAEAEATAETKSEGEAAQTEAAEAAETTEDEEPQAAEATEEGESSEPVEVTSETVTEETTRTSDEDFERSVSEASDDDDNDTEDLLKILGAAGAGLAVGALLDDGGRVVESTGDRVIIERDGQYFVRKDETELLRRPGSQVRTETFSDGSTRTVVERDNGVRVVTIRDSNGYVVRRTKIMPDGREIVLIDDTRQTRYDSRIDEDTLPPIDYSVPRREYVEYSGADRNAVRETLRAGPVADLDRRFTLRQVRENPRLRALMPRLDLDNITFDLGSAAITPSQARELNALGQALEDILDENPDEVFLIEGHTDTVGGRAMNLALSDRRAESVALALTEYYDIPPENLITQGYGEEYLKIEKEGPVRANRRATVRRITPLLETARAQ